MIAPIPPLQQFKPGDLVKHKRYGYRGVIVECDPQCLASDAWYQKNQTQPPREQPWYHVLVDSQALSTYAAQSSLAEDDVLLPIAHPLVDVFFAEFTGAGYVRNTVPWNGQ
ncbi:MAG: heat shock protein HspQ [Pirellulales bacterium]|nr:heat shock protein HspQ [Pirellulales bacterium]